MPGGGEPESGDRQGEFGGATTFSGFGAGGDPTAVAVVSDLMSISRAGLGAEVHFAQELRGMAEVANDFTAPHYLRFTVTDGPGIIASLASRLADHDINIDAVLQLPGHEKTQLPFVMTLEACPASVLDAALDEINALPFHVERPMTVPILGDAVQVRGMIRSYALRNRVAVPSV